MHFTFEVVKKRFQDLRGEGWDSLVENLFTFCVKYDMLIPNFDEFYVNFDWQLQELNDCFNEIRSYLLIGVACLNLIDSFQF